MTQTLTEWWKQLDDETRILATKYEDTRYPDALTTPYTAVDVTGDMTPWQAIHKMASLGAAIETNVMQGQGIAGKIDTARKKLGEQLLIPAITDERSLLLAMVYYRSQCRFHDVQSSNSTVQNGMFGIPGLEQNKPTVAKEAEVLRNKIKDFCSAHQAIASTAQLKFKELFTENNAVGSDLFNPKSLTEQYTEFFNSMLSTFIENIKKESHDKVHTAALNSTKLIKEKLKDTRIQLETLCLYKKLKEFTDDIKEKSEMTLQKFMENLDQDGKQTPARTIHAEEIWNKAKQHANNQKSIPEQITEVVNKYTPGFLQSILHARVNPLAYLPWVIGVDEPARLKRFKEHFNSHLTQEIANKSEELSRETSMKTEDLKIASSKDVQSVLSTNHELILKINMLRNSLKSYIQEVGEDNLIKFSKTSIIGLITKQLAKFGWTRTLLHDNIHYLKIASKSVKQLNNLEKEMKDWKSVGEEDLTRIKESIREQISSVKERSHYLLFRTEREQAHSKISKMISDNEINDNEGIVPKN